MPRTHYVLLVLAMTNEAKFSSVHRQVVSFTGQFISLHYIIGKMNQLLLVVYQVGEYDAAYSLHLCMLGHVL